MCATCVLPLLFLGSSTNTVFLFPFSPHLSSILLLVECICEFFLFVCVLVSTISNYKG